MEGYLEIRTKKLLKSNKKFWFVLGQEQLDYYNDREDASAKTRPLGQIAMSDVLDVRVAQDHRNTITLVRRGQENLKLKVREGQTHNWLGNIRERIFCAREGDVPVLRKKKRRAVRSVSRTFEEEIGLLAKQAQNRCSRSTNDLSQLFSLRAAGRESARDSSSDSHNDSFNQDHLSLTTSFRSRNTSISSSSLFSGSSISSRGSNGHFKRKPRIPVSGFTGRAFLANEKKMVEQAGVITNEDLEYIVQAERDGSPNSDMATDEAIIDAIDGSILVHNDADKENKKEMVSRNVRFNSQQDIHMIENETRCDKKNKTKSKNNNSNNDEKDKSKEAQNTRRRTASFVWGKINIGKYKTSQSSQIKDKRSDTADLDNINDVKNSMSESNHLIEDESTTIKTLREVSNNDKKYDTVEGDNTSKVLCKEEIHINNEVLIGEKELTETESQNKSDDEDKIQLRCELERQTGTPILSKLESSLVRPRYYTESNRRPNELRHEDQLKDVSNKPEYVKRDRVTSVTSTNSRDSLGSMTSSGMKDRIFYWKRSSSRSPKSVTISNPLKTDDRNDEGTISNDINSQIDQIANDRLEAVFKRNKISSGEDSKDPSKVPKKPLKFHIKQLEKMLNGDLNPPPGPDSISEIQLMLDSMLVMQSLSCGSVAPPGADYDVPRQIQIVQ